MEFFTFSIELLPFLIELGAHLGTFLVELGFEFGGEEGDEVVGGGVDDVGGSDVDEGWLL